MKANWSEKLFRKVNPEYRPRWEIYEEVVCNCIAKDTVWLDIGCGKNEGVAEFGHKAKIALGIDKLDYEDRTDAPFLQANLRNIPLPSCYANLVTLRLVAEHLEKLPEDFSEICRLLLPEGRLIVLTTNSLSPLVFLPRLIPFSLKSWLLQKMFGVTSQEVFPTYHRFNTPRKMRNGFVNMKLLELEFL